jgi:hypothetical protein
MSLRQERADVMFPSHSTEILQKDNLKCRTIEKIRFFKLTHYPHNRGRLCHMGVAVSQIANCSGIKETLAENKFILYGIF